MWLLNLFFASVLQIWYVQEWVSLSISDSPLDFKITRVDSIYVHIQIIYASMQQSSR